MSFAYRALLTALALVSLCPLAGLCDGSKLAAGDIVAIAVDGDKELSRQYQVDLDGAVALRMVGAVQIGGLNTSDAAVELTRVLNKVIINPHVTVAYVERVKMQVSVIGQVTRAGLVEIGLGDTVLHALTMAGYDDTADLSRVNVRRGNQIIDLDLAKYLSAENLAMNISLQSGDTVVVPRLDSVGTIMVLGQVEKVGAVPIKRAMTFREVMGLIGGPTVEADTDKITIKREGVTDPLKIDFKRAMDGDPAADIVMQGSDTIYVPEIEKAFFTVMGGVNRAGQYELKGKLTLSEAVGTAGGPAPHVGDMRKVELVRAPVAGSKAAQTMKVDLTKVISKGENDPLVKRGDVIYVAVHREKASLWSVLQSILPFGWIFRK